jgi:hypothetical protein
LRSPTIDTSGSAGVSRDTTKTKVAMPNSSSGMTAMRFSK